MDHNLELAQLTDKEIEAVYATFDIGLDAIEETDKALSRATRDKTSWEIHDWMIDQMFYDPNIDGNPAMFLRHALEAAGIQKPEKMH